MQPATETCQDWFNQYVVVAAAVVVIVNKQFIRETTALKTSLSHCTVISVTVTGDNLPDVAKAGSDSRTDDRGDKRKTMFR